jgi:hypothetical protein
MKQGAQYSIYVTEDINGSVGIYLGSSTDGRSWSIAKSPVLTAGPKGAWDGATVFTPDVVWNGTGYLMFYVGDSGTTTQWRQIGVAFSANGVNWTKFSGNPIITRGPGTYDIRFVRGPSVIYDGGTYKMWYQGTAPLNSSSYIEAIDYATSTDGVHWTKYSANPVFLGYGFEISGRPFYQAYWPSVVKENGLFLMAFSDGYENLGLASSRDGITWSFDNSSTPLVSYAAWHNGFIGNPSLLLDGQRILLWYYGGDNSTQTSPFVTGIGFATCGLALIPSPVVTTTTAVSTATVTKNIISTSISTSTFPTTLVSTLVQSSSAPLFETATAGVVGFAAAMALAVAIIALRVRSRRPK